MNFKFHIKNLEFAVLFCNFATLKINANSAKMEENFSTRLKVFMDSLGIQSSQFADSCEIPRPSFSQLLSGRNQKVSDVLIKKIHSAYPELSIMWLMFGEGNMVSKSEDEDGCEKTVDKNSDEKPEKPNNGKASSGYSNLTGLNVDEKPIQNSIFQQFEDNKKILELQMQIDKLQKNPRRVAQITVYYDDSTFETFLPSK